MPHPRQLSLVLCPVSAEKQRQRSNSHASSSDQQQQHQQQHTGSNTPSSEPQRGLKASPSIGKVPQRYGPLGGVSVWWWDRRLWLLASTKRASGGPTRIAAAAAAAAALRCGACTSPLPVPGLGGPGAVAVLQNSTVGI